MEPKKYMNDKITLVALTNGSGMEIVAEIRLISVNEAQIVFYQGMKRKTTAYWVDKLKYYVLVKGWGLGIDQHRLFRKEEVGFKSFTRQLFNAEESELAYQDCIKQLKEKGLTIFS